MPKLIYGILICVLLAIIYLLKIKYDKLSLDRICKKSRFNAINGYELALKSNDLGPRFSNQRSRAAISQEIPQNIIVYDDVINSVLYEINEPRRIELTEDDLVDISYILTQNPRTHVTDNIDHLNRIYINGNRQFATQQAVAVQTTPQQNTEQAPVHDQTTKLVEVDSYFKQAKKLKSDRQNVHDSEVCTNLQNTYDILKTDLGHIDPLAYKQLNLLLDERNNTIAKQVLNHIINNDLRTYSIRDSYQGAVPLLNVLNITCQRVWHTNNADRREEMQNALIGALEDCIEHGSIVCAGGITARLLTSLVLLDFNPKVGCVVTKQAKKADILSEAHKILRETIDECKRGGDPLLCEYVTSFNDPHQLINHEAEDQFKRIYSRKIDLLLCKYESFVGLKDEIMAAI